MASKKNNDPRVFSTALEIALEIMKKRNWEGKIEDPEILLKSSTELFTNHPQWFRYQSNEFFTASFFMAIQILTTLVEDAVILKPKYVDPISCNQDALLPEFLEDMKERIRNTKICGKNLLVREEPLEENTKMNDLNWLFKEAGTEPDFWDRKNPENYQRIKRCITCSFPITGIYAYCRKELFEDFREVAKMSTCKACYLEGSPNEFVKFCRSPYLLEKLEKEMKRRLRRTQVLIYKNKIQGVDELIPKELHDCFVREMDKLEQISQNDFQPGTDRKVMNLIHPSMYPYFFNQSSYFLNRDPSIHSNQQNQKSKSSHRTSLYQWLPAEVKVDADGCCEFTSYINNLYPDIYPNLYPLLGLIFSYFLPLFEKCLDRPLRNRSLQVIVKASDYILKPGQSYTENWHVEGTGHENIIASGIYYYDVSEGMKDAGLAFRRQRDYKIDWPDPRYTYPKFLEKIWRKCLVKFNLNEGNLQADEDWSFPPEAWFYEAIGDSISCKSDLWISEFPSPVVNLGHVETKPGRCIVFSNSIQHKVAGIHVPETEQKSKKRRSLCFFLVNPDNRLPSSHSVPPQQQRSTPDEVSLILHDIKVHGHHIPLEICQSISQLAFRRITLKEALEHRLRVIYDRRISAEQRKKHF